MPEELKKYFWDTQFELLDKEKNKRYIISRLYCYGDLKAIKWVTAMNYASVIMDLSYFEDAEQEVLPEKFVEYDWDEIKNFFINFQKEFQEEMNKLVY